MMSVSLRTIRNGVAAACLTALAGCCHTCNTCGTDGCGGKVIGGRHFGFWCDPPHWQPGSKLAGIFHTRSNAIPERYPLGSVYREHYHTMQKNAEASDFVFHRNEFVGETSELTPDGKDHVLEIAARMRSAPFPVIVERSEDNANPELDAERRYLVASALNTLGNPDADQRTMVAPAYEHGLRAIEGEMDYYRYLYTRGGFNNNNVGNNNAGGFGGGFGGGGGFGR